MTERPEVASPAESIAARLLVPLGAVLCLLPAVPPAAGLVLGLAVALAVGNPWQDRTRTLAPKLLAASVVGLGAGMDLRAVAVAGEHGFVYTVAGISLCLALGFLLVRALRVEGNTGLLITAGTAICGGSAIAALVPVLRPREQETSVALGTVFLLNAAGLLLFPVLGHRFHLGQTQFGLWAALAIHDTSSVVGAAAQYGPRALEVATTVKLARALWIVPLTFAVGAVRHAGTGAAKKARKPWFIAGFLAAAALATWLPALHPVAHAVSLLARRTMVVTLFLIGANLTRAAVRSVGARPLVLGVSLWACVAAASLGAILLGWVA